MLDGLSPGEILDDLIVTGKNDEQHARNLYQTLKKFEESGAKFKKSKCVRELASVPVWWKTGPEA